jgi:hypothetical protein
VRKCATIFLFTMLVILLYHFPACATIAKWTIMVYIGADNDIGYYGIDKENIKSMEKVGSNADVRVIVLRDTTYNSGDNSAYVPNTVIYEIIKNENMPETIVSPIVYNFGENMNTGDPNTLKLFINWTLVHCPAEHYCLVFSSHGSAWRKNKAVSENSKDKGIIQDDSAGNDTLTMVELKSVLNETVKFDDIAFDACLMGSLETIYQIKDFTNYIIGSEEATNASVRFPYDTILQSLINDPNQGGETLASNIVNEYYYRAIAKNYIIGTMSAFRTSCFNSLCTRVDNFAHQLEDNLVNYRSEIMTARNQVESFSHAHDAGELRDCFIDLYHFAQLVEQYVPVQKLKDAANSVMQGINNVKVNEWHWIGHPNAHGLHIYFNKDEYYGITYDTLDFSKQTRWNEFLRSYLNIGGVEPYDPVDTAIKHGLNYLRCTQNSDGSWPVDLEYMKLGVTELSVLAFLNAGFDETDPVVRKAMNYIMSQQNLDGSFGDVCENYQTSLAILDMVASDRLNNPNKYTEQILTARDWLVNNQNNIAPEPYEDTNNNGKWEAADDYTDLNGNGLYDPGEPIDPDWDGDGILDPAEPFIDLNCNRYWDPSPFYGGWTYVFQGCSDLSNTQWSLIGLYAAGVRPPNSVYTAALRFISRCQNIGKHNGKYPNDLFWDKDDGGLVYQPLPNGGCWGVNSYGSMSFAGLWSYLLCGLTTSDIKVSKAIDWCQSNFSVTENPGKDSWVLYYYYLTMAKAFAMVGQMGSWEYQLRNQLIAQQQDTGYWQNANDEEGEGSPVLCTAYALNALETRTFSGYNNYSLFFVYCPENRNKHKANVNAKVYHNSGGNFVECSNVIITNNQDFNGDGIVDLCLEVPNINAGSYKLLLSADADESYDLNILGSLNGNFIAGESLYNCNIAKGDLQEVFSTATNIAGLTLSAQPPKLIQKTTQIHLSPGWNTISFPLQSVTSTSGFAYYLYKFNGSSYEEINPRTHPEQINYRYGYWAYADGETNVSVSGTPLTNIPNLELHYGWNLIGVPSEENHYFNTILADCGYERTLAFASTLSIPPETFKWLYGRVYNCNNGQWHQQLTSDDTNQFESKKGYWIWCWKDTGTNTLSFAAENRSNIYGIKALDLMAFARENHLNLNKSNLILPQEKQVWKDSVKKANIEVLLQARQALKASLNPKILTHQERHKLDIDGNRRVDVGDAIQLLKNSEVRIK